MRYPTGPDGKPYGMPEEKEEEPKTEEKFPKIAEHKKKR